MKNETKSSNIGFGGMLTLIFITLKLCKVINWSWWWVISPLPISWLIILIIALIYYIINEV